jgi:hypothetical protein
MASRFRLASLSLALILLALPACAQTYGPAHPEWTTPIAPFRIADNLYYVGSKDLASYLVVTPGRRHPHQFQPQIVAAADSE